MDNSIIQNITEKLNNKETISEEDIRYIIKYQQIELLILCMGRYDFSQKSKPFLDQTLLGKIWYSNIENATKIPLLDIIISNPKFNPYSEHTLFLNIIEWLFDNECYDLLYRYIETSYRPNIYCGNMTDVYIFAKMNVHNNEKKKKEKLNIIQKMIYHVNYDINKINNDDTFLYYIIRVPTPDFIEIANLIISHPKFDYVIKKSQFYISHMIESLYDDEIKIIIVKNMINHNFFTSRINTLSSDNIKHYNLVKILRQEYYIDKKSMLEIALHYIRHQNFDPNLDSTCEYNAYLFFLKNEKFFSKETIAQLTQEYFSLEKFDLLAKNKSNKDLYELIIQINPVYLHEILELIFTNPQFNHQIAYNKMQQNEKNLYISIIENINNQNNLDMITFVKFLQSNNQKVIEKLQSILLYKLSKSQINMDHFIKAISKNYKEEYEFDIMKDLLKNIQNNITEELQYYIQDNILYHFEIRNDGIYHVAVLNKSFDGPKYTKIYFNNGDYYEGEIDQTYKKHGFGKYHYNITDYYEGDFYDDCFCGVGYHMIIHQNKREIYRGIFNNNQRFGIGEVFSEGVIKKGFFGINDKSSFFSITEKNTKKYEMHENDTVIILTNEEFQKVANKQCNICANIIEFKDIMFCGCNACTEIYCFECVKKIYGNIELGSYITENNKKCKYCSRYIVSKKITALLNNTLKNLKFGNGEIYGYCVECKNIEKTQIGCNNENLSSKFMCPTCLIKKGLCKKCPSCKVDIIKNGGCNHMTCRCKHEWCWECFKNWKSCNC